MSFSSYGGEWGFLEGLRLRAVVEWAFISFAIEPPRPPAKGHGRVNWLGPEVRMVLVLQVPHQLTSLVVAGQLGD